MGRIIPRGKNPSGGEHIEIEYAPPFAGLDSSAMAPYIRPNALVNAQNFLLADNQYQTFSWIVQEAITWNIDFLGAFDLNGIIYIVSRSANNVQIYTANIPNGSGTPSPPTLVSTIAMPNGGVTLSTLTYININGVTYFSFYGSDAIYQFNGIAGSVLTSYLGGAYLAELNGRLLVTNVWQTPSGGVTSNYPYQFAWSAPGGAYSQFNPLVGGLVTGAGFNNLPDVEDVITGMFTTGPTCYVIRQHGITEVTPLNSGIQPFDFNHLWASHKGIGTVFPQTVAQYGSLGCFVAEDNIYTIGYDGIQTISGAFKSGIYAAINSIGNDGLNPQGVFSSVQIDNNPSLCYILMIPTVGADDKNHYSFYVYSFDIKEWMLLTLKGQTNSVGSFAFPFLTSHNLLFGNISSAFSNIVFWEWQNNGSLKIWVMLNQPEMQNDDDKVPMLVFPIEECAFGRDVTIDGIAMYVETTQPLTINLSINGVFFNSIVPSVGSGLYKSYPTSGTFTAINPQLTLTLSGGTNIAPFSNLSIGKISLFGTVNPEQRPL